MKRRWYAPVPDSKAPPDEWPGMLVVAATVLGEAAGEPLAGKRAVANVIRNRVLDPRWPDTPEEVCLQHLQFSCWNVGSPTLPRMFNPQSHTTEEVWNDCFRGALEAEWQLEPDSSNGANHYLAPRSLKKLPTWASEDKIVAQIGRHVFYRL